MKQFIQRLSLGLDIGSTTVKAVLTDRQSGQVLFRRYQRHHAEQRRTLCGLLQAVCEKFAGLPMRVAVCGSGGRPLADQMGVCYVQEVVANGAAVRALYPAARTAVELGGQDAKVIFFREEADGTLSTSDMRMNGSCAGGTGAFIDEIAGLLRVPAEAGEAGIQHLGPVRRLCQDRHPDPAQPGGQPGGHCPVGLPRHRQADHRRPGAGAGDDPARHL